MSSCPRWLRCALFSAAFPVIVALIVSDGAMGADLPAYSPALERGSYAKVSEQVDLVGDFDGDGLDDVVFFLRSSYSNGLTGDVQVRLARWRSFKPAEKWHDFFSINDELPLVGDFNGDGKDDIVTFLRGASGDVYVALSDGSSFRPGHLWHTWFSIGDEVPVVADINGDGKDDLLTFTRGTSKRVYAALSTGTSFQGTGQLWHDNFCKGEAVPATGDVNGDGKDDIIAFNRSAHSGSSEADVVVALSDGSSFGPPQTWHDYFSVGSEVPRVGDVNGDGKDDVLTFTRGSNAFVYVALSTGTGFASGSAQPFSFAEDDRIPMIGRFDHDNMDDLISFQGAQGEGPIKVALSDWNPYVIWSLTAFPEDIDATEVLAHADADRDGWPNIGEFLIDTIPVDASSHPDLRLQVSTQDGLASIRWTEIRQRADYVQARPEWSADLSDWRPISKGGISRNNERATYAASMGTEQGLGHFRLNFLVE